MTEGSGRRRREGGTRVRPIRLLLVLTCWAAGMPAPAAVGDTIILKSGEILKTRVERFSDGAFWVRDGKKTIVIQPEDILKIVFSPSPETSAAVRPAGPMKQDSKSKSPAILSMPAASAAMPVPVALAEKAADLQVEDTSSRADLAILDYNAVFNSGIFQIVGTVENRMKTDARYVKISVLLLDREGNVSDQNFSYVTPDPPHLRSGEKKPFRVSFINPPAGITKYKIRVESSQF